MNLQKYFQGPTLKQGDRLKIREYGDYIIANPCEPLNCNKFKVVLISVEDGNAKTHGVFVKNTYAITKKEIIELIGNSKLEDCELIKS